MKTTAVCHQCGSKFAGSRDRCPRCRAAVVRANPAAEAAASTRMARIAGGIVVAFVLVVGGLWMMQDAAPAEATVTTPPLDPLAARRRAPDPAPDAAAVVSDAPEDAPRPFVEPSGAGAMAYSAGNYASALAQFEEAVQRNGQDAEALSNLGQVLVRLGRAGEALPYFERATSLNPDRWAYRFNYARALGLMGRWDEAIASYRQAQQLFPDDYVTTFNLGLALHKQGDDAAAVEEYRKAIALDPSDASFRMALASSYERLQNKAEAAAAYGEYLRLAPDAPDADKVRARIAQLAPAAAQGQP